MAMAVLDAGLLENFRRECGHELKFQIEGDLERDEKTQSVLLTALYAYYHYLRADYREAEALREGVSFYDNWECPSVCGIFLGQDEEEKPVIDLLVPLARRRDQTPTELRGEIEQRQRLCQDFLRSLRGTPSDPGPVERRLRDLGFSRLPGGVSARIVFLLHVRPSAKQRSTILDWLDRRDEARAGAFPVFSRLVLFADDIDYEVSNTASAFQFVPNGELLLDRVGNVCSYDNGRCKAAFVNIMAASLRKVWQEKAYRGLLSQNLRYYVHLPRVDDAMLSTMAHAATDFWYLNNGLTIVCKSYRIVGRKLLLEGFSIVNGGQTTHNIGTVQELPMDFALPCKVIAMSDGGGTALPPDDQLDFIAEVCTATNSQKPIKAADAVANRKEIRKLRRALKENRECSIYLMTKKGETLDRRAYPLAWQSATLTQYGQALLSFLYQAPCAARSKTSQLFEDPALYGQLFDGPESPAPFVRDLLRLQLAIRAYKKVWKAMKIRPDADVALWQRRHLVANGEFLLLACAGVFCKLFADPGLERELQALQPQETPKRLCLCDACYPFLAGKAAEGALEEGSPLFRFLTFCLERFIHVGYCNYCADTNQTGNYSNFAKSDIRYIEYIQREIASAVKAGLRQEERNLLGEVFRAPSQEEQWVRTAMLKAHPLRWSTSQAEFDRALAEQLLAKLKMLPSAVRRGAPLPGKQALRKAIALRPTSVRELEGRATLSFAQLRAYGDILMQAIKAAEARRAGIFLHEETDEEVDE